MIESIKILDITKAAYEAGQKILEVYDTDFQVETKEDASPLTLADQKSHEMIVKHLEQLYPSIPILSEEGQHLPFEERKKWETLWIVDPLDGTKEFVNRNGEFTVNIALAHNQKPILGVIYVPVKDEMYFSNQLGAFKVNRYSNHQLKSEQNLLAVSDKVAVGHEGSYKVVASRSHLSSETEAFVENLKKEHAEVEMISAGSSLKFCLVAEGKANVYPRFAPTMEWDTAAGQAIVEAAGGEVVDAKTNQPLLYNKEQLVNNWFIVR
ncbi:3'(2'),5'-bisphosphate nucleotidase CysQ [Niallia endozanthoxylica]|uniref:3'(2'),5'-bisphosphate nucleotidase CysQ n=1 Tax=Niallia endozanthoxylica TaxID=2036016 RepID=UPI001CC75A2D|nr:3'(2'),5'-bisphosphate nucleotidase CysQ [Niallia endozanthoxylica]